MNKSKTEIGLLEEISNKISKLSAIIAAEGKAEFIKIKIYEKAGMNSQEIGSLIGKTAGAVRTIKTRAKKR